MTAPHIETETWADRVADRIENALGAVLVAAVFLIVLGVVTLVVVQVSRALA